MSTDLGGQSWIRSLELIGKSSMVCLDLQNTAAAFEMFGAAAGCELLIEDKG